MDKDPKLPWFTFGKQVVNNDHQIVAQCHTEWESLLIANAVNAYLDTKNCSRPESPAA
jgi:hypothetical protein